MEPKPTSVRRALIVGAGIGGLTAAIALRRDRPDHRPFRCTADDVPPLGGICRLAQLPVADRSDQLRAETARTDPERRTPHRRKA